MPRSEQSTLRRRIREIMPLVLAGNDLAGIQKHAAEQRWQIDQSELSRCIQAAHKRLAGENERRSKAFEVNSLKITAARKALRGLAQGMCLEQFFQPPAPELAPTYAGRSQADGGVYGHLSRRERVVRQLVAQAEGDNGELQLVERATPYCLYRLSDTALPIQLLNILTLVYLTEQLDRAAMVANALFCSSLEPEDEFWDFIGLMNAYLFRVGREGWQQFTQGLGVDGDYLVRENHKGIMLELYAEKICNIAPSLDEARQMIAKTGNAAQEIITAESLAHGWREDFLPIFGESADD